MFRNLTVHTLPPGAIPQPVALDEALQRRPLRSPGPLEMFTTGFVPVLGVRSGGEMTLHMDGHTLLAVGSETRVLPASVVAQAVAEKLDQIEAQRGRRPGGRERQRVKDEVLTDLMPRAFLKPGRTWCWIDHRHGRVYMDTATRGVAETVIAALRDACESFPAAPLAAQSASPRVVLTAWLTGTALPDDFALGEECELRDPADDGAIIRCRRQDLGAEEIAEHTHAGKQCVQLAITYAGRLDCVISEQLVLRKLRYTDVVLDQLGDTPPDNPPGELITRFALMTAEYTRLINRFGDLFDLDFALDGGRA